STIVASTIMAEAQRTVKHDLAIARTIYRQELHSMERTLQAAAGGITVPRLLETGDTAALRDYLQALSSRDHLDFLALAGSDGRVILRTTEAAPGGPMASAVARRALRDGRAVAGTEVLTAEQLTRESYRLPEQAALPLHRTPRSGAPDGGRLTSGLVLAAAAPVLDAAGRPIGVLYAGNVLNRNFALVDQVWAELYREETRRHGEGGTVTIFLGDTRISTNVRDQEGERALGTHVSDEVREAVLERGETWNGRAFVVDDWYMTAYEPIRDVAGEIVGMLYVGLPEASYVATRNRVILSFVLIATVGFLLVLGVTYLGIQRMTRPLGEMVDATRSIAAGDFEREVHVDPDSEGEISRLAGSFNLMLQSLREMRADLEDWGRTLEEKVRARTEELVRMQSRVAQSERLASIGMLAAGVAHEVNNPLGGILALTGLTLEELPEDDPSRENLEEVVRQTERCRDIVRHLLEFSRQTAVSTEELDLNDALDRTLDLLRRQSLFFNIEVRRNLDPALPPVRADRSQLQQVFMNILMNAAQAMHEEGTLTVSTRTLLGGKGVEVAFTDTGCGIPAEHLDRIFDPFFT
ncbi:MAG: HAMP domain-containing protein, partial [Gemmatimonadetes bacterium]|nr:HAMP domain-containing protein [Gemmatimonadota bacterium]NIQ57095.1 HAMP domain-containing protein [Gemmatimonadota bacterium]NIU77262.1 HAMP domain-containing protein [Gammaproteobacteria bacterium]NIX46536.1 HAMP domain-containing protein [Gemmatimonadota bacterium]